VDFKWLMIGAAIGAVLAFFRRGGSVTRGG
jgi:hypothetical protein